MAYTFFFTFSCIHFFLLIAKVSKLLCHFPLFSHLFDREYEEFPTWMAFYWIYTESDSIIGFEIFKINKEAKGHKYTSDFPD